MKLRQLDIENFRGIKSLSIPFDDTTVLIGENNSGKSSILDAIQLCLGRTIRKSGVFTDYDYHLPTDTSEPADADPIKITFYFKETKENEWPDTVLQAFDKATQVDKDTGFNSLTLRVTSGFDPATKVFLTTWNFLDGSGNVMTGAKDMRLITNLPQFAPTFYLAALRDAAQEFRPRSQFWGPFVRSAKIDDEVRKNLEDELSQLNQKVLDAHTTFDGVKDRLKQTTKLVPLGAGEPVHIQALPGKIFDLLTKTQVMLSCRSGAKLPLYRHGEGTQSLAVMFLFDAFLENRLNEEYNDDAEPILALEEPEAHLHPSAIRSLAVLLQGLAGQKIIATHSGDLLAGVPLTAIRRVSTENGLPVIHFLGPNTISADEIEKIGYHIRSQRGHLLFARCWLLVEGQSEFRLIPELAAINGTPFDLHGVCCVEYSQFGSPDLIIRLADDLGIAWHLLADNDSEGVKYVRSAKGRLGTRDEDDHISTYPDPGHELEHHLWTYGFAQIYIDAINGSEQRLARVTSAPMDAEYPMQVISALGNRMKTSLASSVAEAARDKTPDQLPPTLKHAIVKAIEIGRAGS